MTLRSTTFVLLAALLVASRVSADDERMPDWLARKLPLINGLGGLYGNASSSLSLADAISEGLRAEVDQAFKSYDNGGSPDLQFKSFRRGLAKGAAAQIPVWGDSIWSVAEALGADPLGSLHSTIEDKKAQAKAWILDQIGWSDDSNTFTQESALRTGESDHEDLPAEPVEPVVDAPDRAEEAEAQASVETADPADEGIEEPVEDDAVEEPVEDAAEPEAKPPSKPDYSNYERYYQEHGEEIRNSGVIRYESPSLEEQSKRWDEANERLMKELGAVEIGVISLDDYEAARAEPSEDQQYAAVMCPSGRSLAAELQDVDGDARADLIRMCGGYTEFLGSGAKQAQDIADSRLDAAQQLSQLPSPFQDLAVAASNLGAGIGYGASQKKESDYGQHGFHPHGQREPYQGSDGGGFCPDVQQEAIRKLQQLEQGSCGGKELGMCEAHRCNVEMHHIYLAAANACPQVTPDDRKKVSDGAREAEHAAEMACESVHDPGPAPAPQKSTWNTTPPATPPEPSNPPAVQRPPDEPVWGGPRHRPGASAPAPAPAPPPRRSGSTQ